MFLPRGLSAAADARSALGRLRRVFEAETRTDEGLVIHKELSWAIHVDNASFQWEEGSVESSDKGQPPASSSTVEPFKVRGINMQIARGSLVAIVGRVGSGKSSLLLGLIGEMRKIQGQVTFGGTVAYCPQTAWIQNASVVSTVFSMMLQIFERLSFSKEG